MQIDLGKLEGIRWAKRPASLPVVLSPSEVTSILTNLKGVKRVIASLLYGTGMRLTEALKLRVVAPKRLDFRLAVWEPPMTLADTNAAGQSPALQVAGLVAHLTRTP